MKILVIDDQSIVRDLLGYWLESMGHTPLLASDGEQGLAIFKTENPPVVFTDIVLPGISGEEVVMTMRAISSQVYIVSVSGTDEKLTGCDARLSKPFTQSELEAILKKANNRINSNSL